LLAISLFRSSWAKCPKKPGVLEGLLKPELKFDDAIVVTSGAILAMCDLMAWASSFVFNPVVAAHRHYKQANTLTALLAATALLAMVAINVLRKTHTKQEESNRSFTMLLE
jgi:hypothetical protein